jgi:SAM-dependent methyltransferase
MDDAICGALAELNREFYAGFAGDFAQTRRGWLPGFDLILPYIQPAANVLDLGCGNGRFLSFLAARGWRGRYIGVDQSAPLLAIAREVTGVLPGSDVAWVEADLLTGILPISAPVDAILALAVLHHIPGRANRVRFLERCREHLTISGRLILSTWQFMASPRLRARILPWETVGLSADQVESEDYLLAWGQADAGRRYCAWIDRTELDRLAIAAGLKPWAHYIADGREENLNLYGVFERAEGKGPGAV